jgi:hypothetical protein
VITPEEWWILVGDVNCEVFFWRFVF